LLLLHRIISFHPNQNPVSPIHSPRFVSTKSIPTGAQYATLNPKFSDEEKSKHAGLAQENGFAPENVFSLLRAGKMAHKKCAPAREECNKCDPTAAPCF
jgi:hypothetical protein